MGFRKRIAVGEEWIEIKSNHPNHLDEDGELLAKWPPLATWCKSVPTEYIVSKVQIINIFWLPSASNRKIMFISAVATMSEITGRQHKRYFFMRGGSVAILTRFTYKDRVLSALVQQTHVPLAAAPVLCLPAGTFDGGTFAGVAAKELKEETGIEIQESDLTDLTDWAYGSQSPWAQGVYASPGWIDEYFRLFLLEQEVDEETFKKLEQLEGAQTGIDSEHITVRIVQYDDIAELCPDAKTLSALYLYQWYAANGVKQ